jgi:hypothetical protein
MSWENITLLAIGFSLLGLNALLGPRVAVGIARLFGKSASPGQSPYGADWDDLADRQPDSRPSSHSISGVRLSTTGELTPCDTPRVERRARR